ncbi:MAG: glycosyltransferase, partial [Bacilli bacterium]|nr:glycosyltransferase [Bacilli bacterium]
YHLGDVFVSASITETQGLTFMEAMASGIILLCRYDDTLKSTIFDNENGFFFVDEDDMAKKIEMVSTLPEERKQEIIAKAIEGLEPYSMESFYERILHVYERAIKKNW